MRFLQPHRQLRPAYPLPVWLKASVQPNHEARLHHQRSYWWSCHYYCGVCISQGFHPPLWTKTHILVRLLKHYMLHMHMLPWSRPEYYPSLCVDSLPYSGLPSQSRKRELLLKGPLVHLLSNLMYTAPDPDPIMTVNGGTTLAWSTKLHKERPQLVL